MEKIIKPAIVAHCDWSKDAKKRWMTVAVGEGDRWMIDLPEPVGDTVDMFDLLRKRSDSEGSLFVGFDFPIGLPEEYGLATGFADFRMALLGFGGEGWEIWFDVCDSADEISIARPFYPMRLGGVKKSICCRALGLRRATSYFVDVKGRPPDVRQLVACSGRWVAIKLGRGP